jgi:manganese transport protein
LAQISTLQQAHAGFAQLVGGLAALAFAVAPLASGASSRSVITLLNAYLIYQQFFAA